MSKGSSSLVLDGRLFCDRMGDMFLACDQLDELVSGWALHAPPVGLLRTLSLTHTYKHQIGKPEGEQFDQRTSLPDSNPCLVICVPTSSPSRCAADFSAISHNLRKHPGHPSHHTLSPKIDKRLRPSLWYCIRMGKWFLRTPCSCSLLISPTRRCRNLHH